MSALLLLVLLLLLVGTAVAHLVATVRLDGLGLRPPPPSHHPYFAPRP